MPGRSVRSRVAEHRILAVHRRVPETSSECVAVDVVRMGLPAAAVFVRELCSDERNRIQLVLDRPQIVAGALIQNVVHPAIADQWTRSRGGVSGTRMGIRIGALEYCSELFHQLASIGVLLELLNQLPRDVISGVSRHHVSNETLALRR